MWWASSSRLAVSNPGIPTPSKREDGTQPCQGHAGALKGGGPEREGERERDKERERRRLTEKEKGGNREKERDGERELEKE